MNLNLSYPFTDWFEITATGRISSGQPFTPIVQRDINGDGVANDRAFVFDPGATADTSVANAMGRLLDDVPGRIRSCLEDQFGSIAERNSCRLGWSQSLDMRVSVRPPLPTLGRRVTLQADLRNVLSGLDQLFHGSNVKGWGETQQIERQLLYPRAFDPLTNSFVYEVNEGFGQTRRGQGAIRSVFAIRLQANISVGGQRDNQGFRAPLAFGGFGGFGGDGGGRGGRGGGGIRAGQPGVQFHDQLGRRLDREAAAHVPVRCSGRIGTRSSGNPVASRTAATIAGVAEIVGGSPTPRSPYGAAGSASSSTSTRIGGMSRIVGIR
jgi:hypothetical protein